MSSKSTQDKRKRKISKNPEAELSYKFREDPIVERVDLEVEAKRQ